VFEAVNSLTAYAMAMCSSY